MGEKYTNTHAGVLFERNKINIISTYHLINLWSKLMFSQCVFFFNEAFLLNKQDLILTFSSVGKHAAARRFMQAAAGLDITLNPPTRVISKMGRENRERALWREHRRENRQPFIFKNRQMK